MSIHAENENLKTAAGEHLQELNQLKTDLLADKPIKIPKYGKDKKTKIEEAMGEYLSKRASAEATRNANQKASRSGDTSTILVK